MQKIDKVLLIDDDVNTNFYNRIIIEDDQLAKEVIDFQNAKNALDYLISQDENLQKESKLILLDINMPIMNGWEFLEAYNALEDTFKADVVITMLTSSLNPDDIEKAKELKVEHFINKPLEADSIKKIISEYF